MTTNEHNPITSDLPTDGSNHAAGRVWNKPPKSLRVILAAHERYRQHLLATGADVADAVRWAPPPAAKPRRRRQPSFARLAAKAKALGVVITLEPNGAVTVRADNTADPAINEWDAELIHGKH